MDMQLSADLVWGAAQQQLRTTLNTDIYNLWFLPIKALALEEETLKLGVASDFCGVWLKDHYRGLLQDVLKRASGQNLKVKFRVNPAGAEDNGLPAPEGNAKATARPTSEPIDHNAA